MPTWEFGFSGSGSLGWEFKAWALNGLGLEHWRGVEGD